MKVNESKVLIRIILPILLGLAISMVAKPTFALSSGPNNGSSFNTDYSGVVHWTNTSLAETSNNAYTTVSVARNVVLENPTDFLTAQGFGFSIPSTATIDGVLVQIEKRRSNNNGTVYDNTVSLIKSNTIQGDNRGEYNLWPISDTVTDYGGSADLWGLNLSASDINSSDFGVGINVDPTGGSSSTTTAYIDHITITVYYTPASSSQIIPLLGLLGINTAYAFTDQEVTDLINFQTQLVVITAGIIMAILILIFLAVLFR